MGGGRQKRGACDNLSRRIVECGDKVAAAAVCCGRIILPAPVFLLFEHASLSCFIFDSDDKTYRLFPPQRYKTFPGKSRGIVQNVGNILTINLKNNIG
jgi:hypothetical protein